MTRKVLENTIFTKEKPTLLNRFKIVATAAFLAISASPVLAEADGPDFFRVVNVNANDVLNIRSEASAHSQKIGQIPATADGIQNLGCIGQMTYAEYEAASDVERAAGAHRGWCNIAYDGIDGWVAARYLGEGSAPASATTDSANTDDTGAYWAVIRIESETPVSELYVSFLADGRIFGSDGCNQFNSSVHVAGDHLIIASPYASTTMACGGGLESEQEMLMNQLLQSEPSFIYDPVFDQMTLTSGDGGISIVLQRLQ